MPIYEYRCDACGQKLEALQKLSDSPLTDCPACGKPRLSKLLTAAGFQLKGSGWYATDFKSSGSKPEAAKGNGAAATKASAGEASPESKSEGKSDSKSESKSEAASGSGSTSGSTSGGCGSGCSCH